MGVIDLGFHIEKCVLNFIKRFIFHVINAHFKVRVPRSSCVFGGVYKMAAGGLKCYLVQRGVVTSGSWSKKMFLFSGCEPPKGLLRIPKHVLIW